ncbi:SGNH/GDSL hydrolase family protein [Alistipes sp. OttesenSCG-928-L06]|nr:SGNH/GDSL hydrolase family protein [Alistipes sp. OttesenSCG-928-L06]
MNNENAALQTDFFAGCAAVPANRTLEVEIATACRVGLDGASVEKAVVDENGELVITLTDGRAVNAGTVAGKSGLKGIAHFDTVPQGSPDPQLYIASGKGTYGYFRNEHGQPIQLDKENTIAFFSCPAGGTAWDYAEMTLDMSGYRPRADLTFLSSRAPVFSNYPPAVEAVEGLYDEATGRFNLAKGQTTVTSQTEVFGRIVYTGCSHILVGFNASYTMYLEVKTGKCLCMNVFTKATHYHAEPFAPGGITQKYVRVNTYNPDSMVIDIEQSDNGHDYTLYAQVNRGAWPGLFITYRTIGFYRPAGSTDEPKILSIGRADRLMLDEVPVLEGAAPETFEVLVPSDNFAGIARRKISLGSGSSTAPGKSFAGQRIVLYGDSIGNDYGIAPGTYAGLVRQKFGTDDVVCHGQTGEMLGSLAGDRSDSLTDDQQIGYVVSLAPDLLIIQAGASDYWHSIDLGDYWWDIEDPYYQTTATGGLRYLLHHLRKNLPRETRVLFATPPPGTSEGMEDTAENLAGYRMPDYVRRFREVCAEYNVLVCDVWALAGWPTLHEAVQPKYTIDGVHLSPEGYDRMTDLLLLEASRYC